MRDKMAIEGMTTLITGASSGIGFELARIFAAERARLILVAYHHDKLGDAVDVLRMEFPDVELTSFVRDLGVPGEVDELVAEVDALGWPVDILVNDAGFGDGRDFVDTPLETLTSMIHTNVVSLTVLTRRFLSQMLGRKSGKILNLASTGSFIPGPHLATYCATKAYVLKLSQAIHYELRGSGVTVTALCPGGTDTHFAQVAGMEDTMLFNRFVMCPEDVARIGFDAMMQGKRQATAGFRNQLMTFLIRLSPVPLTMKLADGMLRHRPERYGPGSQKSRKQ